MIGKRLPAHAISSVLKYHLHPHLNLAYRALEPSARSCKLVWPLRLINLALCVQVSMYG